MYSRLFSVLTGAGSFFCVDFPVDDSKPSSPLLMPFFNESLLPISFYFNFNTSFANSM